MKNKLCFTILGAAICCSGCIQETFPTSSATASQIEKSSLSLDYLTNGLSAFLTTWDTYGTTGNTRDWGYPCQMFMREVLGEDFAAYSVAYDYWSYVEDGTGLTSVYYYPFYYYYSFIKRANTLISAAGNSESDGAQASLGQGLAFRAYMYLDLFRLYEYRKTGITSLDDVAESRNLFGMTVPIVTEDMTRQEMSDNPSVPFYTMYRFIMNDLDRAEECLDGYTRANKSFMDQSVVYGLKARLYLDMASRFGNDAEALAQQVAAEGSNDGYGDIGITSAGDCWGKVAEYAKKVIDSGKYTPLTEEQWSDPETGFNTPQPSWVFGTYITTREQVNTDYYWNTYPGELACEASWGMMSYGNWRMISSELFNQISDSDWRKASWVAPEDALGDLDDSELPADFTIPSKYRTNLPVTDSDASHIAWRDIPAYTGIKFRPGSGSLYDKETGLIVSLPLMRVEEMYFDYFEAIAHTEGVGSAAAALQEFVNTYRYADGSYKCTASDLDSFITELMVQRRIEFWGEGINMFDYKRLNIAVTRKYDGSNYLSSQQINTMTGYVAPWMNYLIPSIEEDANPAIVYGPDASGVMVAE